MTTDKPLRIAFVHPDLGIGGAERLIVDAATGLQRLGHHVTVFTSHHDSTHCFQETRDGTLDVRVLGNTLVPRSMGGRFYIFCAWLRGWHLCLHLLWNQRSTYDVVICDQLSAYIPILRGLTSRILFYCHFPDKYLVQPGGLLKRLYRVLFDYLEEHTTALADRVVVNSHFTAQVFQKAFPSIQNVPHVLHPGIHTAAYDHPVDNEDPLLEPLRLSRPFLLSINRFERKKNIQLAIDTLARAHLRDPSARLQLVVAGGYDKRVSENVEYLQELIHNTDTLGLSSVTLWADGKPSGALPPEADVIFLPSFTENQRTYLLRNALCLLYTPSFEHFGIVPVEAMYARLPVIAVNSGGPKETVVHEVTGFLCPPDPEEFSRWVHELHKGSIDPVTMGERGRAHVLANFTLDTFIQTLDTFVTELATLQRSSSSVWSGLLALLILALVIGYNWL
ncbi:Alpha-1,3-mannosyltransferase-like protein [Dispira parvispora]|uniref:Alpha-1,3/1,6-mannosyltransferase ALG2 n=1 Tax=Dispira parvispora TaxID=1520584 RepID=A0A9W8APQ2_9FUNG|nr:Alpha-1,3-mannosyltransferase-like protein [Dispira parvispora]